MTEPAEPRLYAVEPPPDDEPLYEPPPDEPPPVPSDPAAEQAVIGALLLDPQRALPDVAAHIAPQDFWQPRHELIYRAIVALHAQGAPIDVITVAAELARTGDTARAGGTTYLHTLLSSVPTAANAAYYARIVAQTATARRLDELGKRLVQAANGGDTTELHARLEQAHAWITEALDQTPGAEQADPRLVPAGQFILNGADTIDALWGAGDDVLWMRGESLIVAGPTGVGKTTLGQQATLARIGVRPPELLGQPLQPAARCLYLAMDRPLQAKRSLARMVQPDDIGALDERMTIWKGPPPEQVIANPRALLDLARRAGLQPGDFVVIDSVKDVAIGIAKDDVGAAVNTALQELLAADIDVLALHHTRKGDHATAGKEPQSIDEIYGSSHITNGAGSVISLWGAPGDPVISLRHMKQPASEVGPYKLKHAHEAGVTEIWHGVDVLQAVLDTGTHGMSAKALATLLFPKTDDIANSESEIEKARRRLDRLVVEGHLLRRDPPDGARRGTPATYVTRFTRSGEYRE